MKPSRLSIVSGGFDPVHVGHLDLFKKASNLARKGARGDLFVIVNDDKFLTRKKGKPFMTADERMHIIESFRIVDNVFPSIDEDDTVCKTLEWIHTFYQKKYEKIMFCNGGDRTVDAEKPEHKLCLDIGIEPVYGLGEKIQSSSWLISDEKKDSRSHQSDAGSLIF
jgi:cytidyltransferase-like protein